MATVKASWLRAAALGLWALTLLHASADGRLELLLAAVFHPLVGLAGSVLLACALGQVVLAWRCRHRDEAAGRRDWMALLATSLITLLLISLPPNPSFADLAQQRPSDETGTDDLAFVLPPAQRSLTDWVRLLRSQNDPRLVLGEPVRISGFVLPREGGAPLLARLLVRCCLADATPVGLAVRWPPDQPLPRADQWLAISGEMGVQRGPDGEEPVVLPEQIRAIPRPARPLEP